MAANNSRTTKYGDVSKNNGNAANSKGVVSKGKGKKISDGGMGKNKGPHQSIGNSTRIGKWC